MRRYVSASHIASQMLAFLRRQRLYVGTIALALVLTMVWCLSVPDMYVSQVKVSDEAKEMDLNIGLDFITVTTRDLNPDAGNESQNDVDVYSLILNSIDFADSLSNVWLQGREQTYREYCNAGRKYSLYDRISSYCETLSGNGGQDCAVDVIHENLKHNLSKKYRTLTIQFSDPDPMVAALMVDSAASHLQRRIDAYRHNIQVAKMNAARMKYRQAHDQYEQARHNYDAFMDAHQDTGLEQDNVEADAMRKEVSEAYDQYTKLHEEYTRAYALSHKYVSSFAVLRNATVSHHRSSPVPLPIFLAVSTILLTIVYVWQRGRKLYGKGHVPIEWGKFFSPWTIMLLHWGVIMILFVFEGDLLDPLSEQFYVALSLWVSVFVITSFCVYQFLPRKNGGFDIRNMAINTSVFHFFFWLSVIITPLHLFQIMKIVMMFDTADLLNNIRTLALSKESETGLLNYSYVINQVLLVVAMCKLPNIERWRLTVIIICTLISAFAVMEKGILLYLIIVSLFACYEKHYIRLHTIALIFVAVLGVFFVLTLARFADGDSQKQSLSFLDFFAIYILSGPVAFGRLVEDLTMQFGANTFQTIYLFLNRLMPGQFEVHQALQEFVWIPLPTNVYTVMQPFFIDFGYGGVAFFAFLYGLVCALFYRGYQNGSAFCFGVYAYIAFVLMIQFHQEEIFYGLVHFIQFLFFTWIFTYDGIKLKFNR